MSAKKYVLHPNGQIKVVTTNNSNQDNEESAGNVTQDILKNQDDFFSERDIRGIAKIPASNFLPTGTKGLAASIGDFLGSSSFNNNAKEYGIISKETPEFLNGSLFPAKNDSNLLINSSFGADNEIKYYKNYNSAFADLDINKNIYAEELEMLAGVELNSLGIAASAKGIDLTMFTIVFDYILELTTYVSAVLGIMRFSDNIASSTAPLITYFRDLISNNNLFGQLQSRKSFSGQLYELNTCFIIGLNEYINTDPKFGKDHSATRKIDLEAKKSERMSINTFNPGFDFSVIKIPPFVDYLKNTLISASKIGRNRVFLLIRKFQQESYWHSEILYKAKSSNNKLSFVLGTDSISPENSLDRFFAEFSQYYFKFFIERVHIGRILLNFDSFARKTYKKTLSTALIRNRHYDKGSYYDYLNSPSSNFSWTNVASGPSNIAIRKLPSLLKSTNYFKHSKLGQLQNNIFGYKKNNIKRFDKETVTIIEKHLEAEYMPFYFHDIRTNEIISFHAFLDSITDNFNPEYTSTSGYGRIDDVKHYIKTTRNINLTFNVVAMNSRDYDEMWYKINKIVSLVYPQWSQGIPSNAKKADGTKIMPENFRFPFTQVPTASPLIRLRVGDVLKTNFSQSSFSRLHGNKVTNHTKDETKVDKSTVKTIGTPSAEETKLLFLHPGFQEGITDNGSVVKESLMAYYERDQSASKAEKKQEMIDVGNLTYYIYYNFFAAEGGSNDSIQDANNAFVAQQSVHARSPSKPGAFYNHYNVDYGDASLGYLRFITKPLNVGDGQKTTFDINKHTIPMQSFDPMLDGPYGFGSNLSTNTFKIRFEDVTKKIYDAQKENYDPRGDFGLEWFNDLSYKFTIFKFTQIFAADFNQVPNVEYSYRPNAPELNQDKTVSGYMIFASPIRTSREDITTVTTTTTVTTERGYKNTIENIKDITKSEINDQTNNAFAKSFESSQGKGLAGFITMLDIGYSESTWQTDTPGSNAPHTVKIGINFSPIHDISPGIDHEGVLRAPVYPVGDIVNKVFNSRDSDVKIMTTTGTSSVADVSTQTKEY